MAGSNMLTSFSRCIAYLKTFRVSKTSYAKTGEDLIIASALQRLGIRNPAYIDIGTWHPIRSNNTYYFYKKGKRGVLVEPNPDMAALIKRTRPRDVLLNVGVAPTEGAMEYYVLTGSQNNTFSKQHADTQVSGNAQKIKRTIRIPVVTLSSLLERYPCDLLSLDAEELDFDILKSVDFSIHHPTVVCVETLVFDGTKDRKVNEISDLLIANGYELYGDTYVNSIYLRPEAKVVPIL